MQWLKILRGCLAACVAGVICIGVANANAYVRTQGIESIAVVAKFGLLAMIPFTIIAMIIWTVPAGIQRYVMALRAILICGATFAAAGVLLAIAGGPASVSLVAFAGAFVTGCAFGTAFWRGVFGLAREAQMGRQGNEC